MARRGNGEGSIFKAKDGRWVALLDIGYVSGRRRRKAFYGATRRDVQLRLVTALRSQQQGLPIAAERQTVSQFLRSWLEAAENGIRPRTFSRYRQYVELHAIPAIGSIPLSRLTPQDLQQLYAMRLEAGASSSTVAHLHAVLHRALSQGERWGILPRNVAALVDAPRISRTEMATLSSDQVRRLIAASTDERLGALYVLAVTTGMRQGELLALRWKDIDLDTATVTVSQTLQRTNSGLVFSEPKSRKSRRRVSLADAAVTAIRRHRVAQAGERLKLGPTWDDGDLVFANEVGRPLEATNVIRRSFRPLLERAGLPRIRFHDLRHTAATLMLAGDVHPKIVSEMLGHSQIGLTLDVYSHVTPTMQKAAVTALNGLLGA